MVGDFNLTPRDMEVALPAWKDLTTGSGSTINSDDGVSNNLYDHVLVPPDEPNLAGLRPAEVLDVRSYAKDDTFFRSISDHLPIRFVLSP
jgi:hypothetical protein